MKKNYSYKQIKILASLSLPLFLTPIIVACSKTDKAFSQIPENRLSTNQLEIQNISISNITTNSADVRIKFVNSNKQLTDFSLVVNDKTFRSNEYDPINQEIIFHLKNLQKNMKYELKTITANRLSANLSIYKSYFTTLNQQISKLEPKKSEPENPEVKPEQPSTKNYTISGIDTSSEQTTANIIFNFNEAFVGNENLTLVLKNNSDQTTIEKMINTSYGTRQTFNFTNLVENTTYSLVSLKNQDKNINLNEFINWRFTTKEVESIENHEDPKDSIAKVDKFIVSNINASHITANSAVLTFSFSNYELANDANHNFSLVLNNQTYSIDDTYTPNSNNLTVEISNLKPNTTYNLNDLRLNNNSVSIDQNSFSFQTLQELEPTPPPSQPESEITYQIQSLGFSDLTINSARLNLTTNPSFTNKNLRVMLEADKRVETYDFHNTNEMIFNDLEPDTTYTVVGLIIDGKEVDLENQSLNFTTLNNDSPLQNPQSIENDNFTVNTINITNITNTSANVNIIFSNHELKDNSANKFVLTINNQTYEAFYTPNTSSVSFDLKHLNKNTTYNLSALTLNTKNIPINDQILSFTTTNEANNSVDALYYTNINFEQANVVVRFKQPLDNDIIPELKYHKLGSNQEHSLTTFEVIDNQTYQFNLTSLLPGSQYVLDNITTQRTKIDFTNDQPLSFTTSFKKTNNDIDIDISDMGSFAIYDKMVSEQKTTHDFRIKTIIGYKFNDHINYLIELNEPTKKQGLIKLVKNNKTYYQHFDGNGNIIVLQVSDVSENELVINFDEQNIIVPVIRYENASLISQTNTSLTSFNLDQTNNNLTLFLGNAIENSTYLITLKPDVNVSGADLQLAAKVINNRLVFNHLDYLNPAYNRYVLTHIKSVNTNQIVSVAENQIITINNLSNYPTITKVKIQKDSSTNVFYGTINFNWQQNQEKLFTGRYLRLTFIDKQQKETPVDGQNDITRYGFYALGYGYLPRDKQPANLKYVYLNFDEFKQFKFDNLVEETTYELYKIELVNKYDLQPIHNFNFTSSHFIGLNLLTPRINQSNLAFTDAFGTNFMSNPQANSTVTSYATLKAYDMSDATSYSIDFNYNNYRNLNRYYIYATQKFNQVYRFVEDYSPKKRTVKEINFANNQKVNWGVVAENYNERQWQETDNRKKLTITKNLNNFINLNDQNDILMNLNFFASVKPINLDEWELNHFSYSLSFSYNQLKNAPSQTLDNVKIDFVQNWETMYKSINHLLDGNYAYRLTLDEDNLEKILNDRISAKIVLKGNQLIITLTAKNGVMNKDLYIHNLSQSLSTYVDKANTFFSVMSIPKNNNDLVYESNQMKDIFTNVTDFKGYMYELRNHFVVLDDYDKPNKKLGMEFAVSNWKTTNDPVNKIHDDVIMRSIGLDFGTGWLISKVKPSDPNDYHYYIATNKHVPIDYSEALLAPKPHTSQTDTSYYHQRLGKWNLETEVVWEATANKKIDGTYATFANYQDGYESGNEYLQKMAGTDLQIAKINVKPLIDYYLAHKDQNSIDDTFKVTENVYNWINVNKNTKFSQQGRYIRPHTFATFYLSSFPGSLSYGTKHNIQMQHNFVGDFMRADYGSYGLTLSYGFYNEFPTSTKDAEYQLQPGSSGTGIYDAKGDFIAIHAGKDAGQNGAYILSTPRMNFMGELYDYNNHSFAYYIQRKHRLYPEKYDMLNVFYTFEKPFNK
ncbi:hypothetical protein OF377_00100 [Ureaplasma sp. ES3154-GEN]|uniref:DUF1410 domain-containing protein n=1 Tax=Ureaplasma sp. ES3154-GEN TaxID=2984844 RepID=UPI0021E9637E|nr:DUF1410 domain-containing protein [Ureaplasma sp. ES3154-GEN]MCV3743289.1 hypothetical protein [Ureaplasma sp. ES3154-GEN]